MNFFDKAGMDSGMWPLRLGYLVPVVFWGTTVICGGVLGDYDHSRRLVSELGALGTPTQLGFSVGLALCALLSAIFIVALLEQCKVERISIAPVVLLTTFTVSMAGAGVFPHPLRMHADLGWPAVLADHPGLKQRCFHAGWSIWFFGLSRGFSSRRPAIATSQAALGVCSAACLAIMVLLGCDRPHPGARLACSFPTMGTVATCDLALPAHLTPQRAQAMVHAVYDSVEIRLSAWRADSELSRLNRAPADSAFTASPLLSRCLAAADQLRRDSGGAFDPTAGPLMEIWGFFRHRERLPSPAAVDSARALLGGWRFDPDPPRIVKERAATRFDLGGIAKGLAVDLAADSLRGAGVTDGLLDLGGNLFCLGGAPGRKDWRVGIKDPLDKERIFATVRVSGAAVATSGSYEKFVTVDGRRYGHIMNPATGRPAEGLLSATAIAPTATLADGLSTALFVLGRQDGLAMLAGRHPDVQAVLVVPGEEPGTGVVAVTAGLRDRVEILPEYAGRYRLEE